MQVWSTDPQIAALFESDFFVSVFLCIVSHYTMTVNNGPLPETVLVEVKLDAQNVALLSQDSLLSYVLSVLLKNVFYRLFKTHS